MIKKLLFLFLLFPALAYAQVSPPSTYVPQLITYQGVPFGVCAVYQIAENVTNGNYYTCNISTHLWQSVGGGGGISGSIAATQVAFGSGVNAIAGSANFTYLPATDGVSVLQSTNSTSGFTDTLAAGVTGSAGFAALADVGQSQTNSPFTLHDPSLNSLWGVQSDGSMKSSPNKNTSPIAIWKVTGATGLQTAPLLEANYQSTGTNSSQVVFRGSGLGTSFSGSPAIVNVESQALAPWNQIWTDTSLPNAFIAMFYNVDHPEFTYTPDGTNFVGALAFQQNGVVQVESNGVGARVEILGNLVSEAGNPTQSVGTITTPWGNVVSSLYTTATNCTSSASPAVCSAAAAGSVVVAAAATSVVVNTSAVTANSQIFVQFDSSLGTKLGVTCNATVDLGQVTARSAGVSFTITSAAAPAVNPACYSFFLVN